MRCHLNSRYPPGATWRATDICLYPCVYINTSMAVKTITVTEDAYRALAALKREGESFSDVIRRITQSSRSLLEFAGDWKDIPKSVLREYEEWLRQSDDLSKQKLRKIVREMSR